MEIKKGDWVIHCAHGLGQVVGLEEQANNGKASIYYMVQLTDLTIWVPDDENLENRLRFPSTKSEFQKMLNILSSKAEALPTDRRQRTLQLQETLRDGRTESLCRVIRDLQAVRGAKTWSEYDSAILKRAQKALSSEWSYVHSISTNEAEVQLSQSLSSK
ncbi:MAG: CarD family transcriptional regulator [Anaerolineales bacterium]